MDVPCGLRVTTGKVGRRRGEDRSEEARAGITKPPDGYRGRWEMNTTARAKAIPPIFVGKWTTNLVRTERRGLSAWTAKAAAARSLATNAHQNPLQSRICATHREKVVGIEPPRCSLFLDRTGARIHSTADQHVQLGGAAR